MARWDPVTAPAAATTVAWRRRDGSPDPRRVVSVYRARRLKYAVGGGGRPPAWVGRRAEVSYCPSHVIPLSGSVPQTEGLRARPRRVPLPPEPNVPTHPTRVPREGDGHGEGWAADGARCDGALGVWYLLGIMANAPTVARCHSRATAGSIAGRLGVCGEREYGSYSVTMSGRSATGPHLGVGKRA